MTKISTFHGVRSQKKMFLSRALIALIELRELLIVELHWLLKALANWFPNRAKTPPFICACVEITKESGIEFEIS